MRLLTFASVIAVHSIGSVGTDDDLSAGIALQALHFGRETFFLITGFVLVFTNLRKELGADLATVRFWRKRFALIGLPYTVWSVIYWATRLGGESPVSGHSLSNLLQDLVFGTARYHLYFLQVSMQAYLVFPVLLWFVRRTRGHHALVVGISAAVQLAWFSLLRYVAAPDGWLQNLWTRQDQLLLTYQFYLIAGAVAACHYDALSGWVSRNTRAVVGILVGTAVLNWAVFAAHLAAGWSPAAASVPLQPAVVVWGVAMSLALLALGLRFSRTRRPGPSSSFVSEASRISFGVYLAHPLVLTGTLDLFGLSHGESGLPTWLASLIAWVCTAVGAGALVEVLSRTPLAMAFTGRPRAARRTPPVPSRETPKEVVGR